ncbi:MAG: HAMP domain-containing histidine kinase [Clostridia bacterium]|nr:HAMP domain-containing histidine kinase [Clostridia bacterium]
MVKTAQRRFIFITLSILFVVFAAIFAFIWGINTNAFARETMGALSDAERAYNDENDAMPPPFFRKYAVIELSSYAGNYYFYYGEENFTQDTVKAVLEKAFSHGDAFGNVGNIYFKTVRSPKTVVFIADMSEEAERVNSALLQTLLLLGISFAALGALVCILSNKVFEPIRRILTKQKQFISDASHELKTPVTIISANTEVIATEENKVYTDGIKKQVERLNFLVNDLLTLARLDEGNTKIIKESFDLSGEIMQTVLPFDAVVFEKGKTLKYDIDENIIIEGSKDSVRQIINILLDNAVKYSAAGGEIKVSLKKQGGKILLSVYNDGSLIPEQDAEKIFERFYRGDSSRARDSGGNGLGLSIAKSIAVANKWSIEAVSVFGKSMTINLTL